MNSPQDIAAGAVDTADDRFQVAKPLRATLNKVFPDHWSFMLGEIALYSFIILLITGTYLTFFFDPSMKEVVYNGSYVPLRGVHMSSAYESTLGISFDVRGGLIIRQIHHWAALLFIAAMVVHMMRTFFTGAYRRPRETNWLVGITLLTLGLIEGFAGYSLPDDLLSGTGLRIADAVILSIPVIGTYVSFALFGGEFPGDVIIGRLYIVHVLLIPGILLALIAVHMLLLVKQKHTQFPGPGATNENVVGVRMFPTFAAKGGGFFALVFGVMALFGGIAQINPVWLYGPYDPSVVSAGTQPDWYIGFLDGSLRLMPPWEIRWLGHSVTDIFWAAVVIPGLMFTLAGAWPFLEQKFTKDRAIHNLLQRPRDAPTRTALGAMAISFYCIMWIAAGNDILATTFDMSINAFIWGLRISLVVFPPLVYWTTQKVCLGLQQHDREVLAHGVETGLIKRLPHGEFIEVHQPLGETDSHGHPVPVPYLGEAVPRKLNKLGLSARSVRGFFAPIEQPSSPVAREQDSEQRELTGAGKPQPPDA